MLLLIAFCMWCNRTHEYIDIFIDTTSSSSKAAFINQCSECELCGRFSNYPVPYMWYIYEIFEGLCTLHGSGGTLSVLTQGVGLPGLSGQLSYFSKPLSPLLPALLGSCTQLPLALYPGHLSPPTRPGYEAKLPLALLVGHETFRCIVEGDMCTNNQCPTP